MRRNQYEHRADQTDDRCLLSGQAGAGSAALPDGVLPSFIQYLDAIQTLEQQGIQVKVSDLSDALSLPRPGVTRTVKDMEARGLLTKHTSPEDGRVTYLTITEAGRALSRKYDAEYFSSLVPALEVIPEEDAETMIRTIEIFYQIMVERRDSLEK